MFSGAFQPSLKIVILLALLTPGRLAADPGDLAADFVTFATIAPQDITYDESEDCFWITAFLDNRIYKYSTNLEEILDTIPSPFEVFEFTTGITYNSIDDTLLVTNAGSGQIVEINKQGIATGRVFTVPFLENPRTSERTVRGLAFDPAGDDGGGSIYLVEIMGTLVYELSLAG